MLLLDTGAFLAIEKGDRTVAALIKDELRSGRSPKTHGGVIARCWRGGTGRQAPIAAILPGIEVLPLDLALGKETGLLLKRARASDVVDAALVALAGDDDQILTSDVEDLELLAVALGLEVEIVPV